MVKHQSSCFRTIGGRRFTNFGDILCTADEIWIERAKALGIPHRVVRHPDGFRRLFVLASERSRLLQTGVNAS